MSLIIKNGGPGAEPPEKFLRSPNPAPLKIPKSGGRGGGFGDHSGDLKEELFFSDLECWLTNAPLGLIS